MSIFDGRVGAEMTTPALRALSVALERLEDGDREAALGALLEAWRMVRAPAIADAIDLVSADLTRDEKPLRDKKSWEAAAKAARPAAFGRLLEGLPAGRDRAARLRRVCAWLPDPRAGTFVRTWLVDPPVVASSRVGFFHAVDELIAHTGDVRLVPLLERMSAPASRSSTIACIGLKNWTAFVERGRALAQTSVPAIGAEEAAVLARIVARVGRRASSSGTSSDPAELFARVYANPDDDEPRAVLGDLLQQRGDPRGEHIALQLARHGTATPPSALERKLEKTWGRTWLGAIEPAVLHGGVVFERGFATHARYAGGKAGAEALHADEWSTITHLDVTQASKYAGGSAALLLSKNARAIRHVVGLHPEDLAGLTAAHELPWETLGWRAWSWLGLPIFEGPGARFAAVRKLVLSHAEGHPLPPDAEQVAAMLASWPGVRALELDAPIALLAPVLADARSAHVRRLAVLERAMAFTVDRDAKQLAVGLAQLYPQLPADLARLLAALAAATSIERADVRVEGKATRAGDELGHRHVRISIEPLRVAAARAGVALTVQDEPA